MSTVLMLYIFPQASDYDYANMNAHSMKLMSLRGTVYIGMPTVDFDFTH